MKMLVKLMTLALLAAGIAACGDDGSTAQQGGSGGSKSGSGGSKSSTGGSSSTSSGSGGSKSGTGGASGGTTGSKLGKVIMSCSGTSSTDCPGIDEYASCVADKCLSTYEMCFGKGFNSGSFSGACAAFGDCTTKESDPCNSTCTQSSECTTCLMGLGSKLAACAQTATDCKLPDCATSSGSGGSKSSGSGGSSAAGGAGIGAGAGGTCKDLMDCCNKVTNADLKSACQMAYDTIKPQGDAACGAVYSGVKSQFCP